MARFDVSPSRSKKTPVPPAGHYTGTVIRIVPAEQEGRYVIAWRFRVPHEKGRQYTLTQTATKDELSDTLHDLGYAGHEIELEDVFGSRARIEVRTYGGRKVARVTDVFPLPEGG